MFVSDLLRWIGAAQPGSLRASPRLRQVLYCWHRRTLRCISMRALSCSGAGLGRPGHDHRCGDRRCVVRPQARPGDQSHLHRGDVRWHLVDARPGPAGRSDRISSRAGYRRRRVGHRARAGRGNHGSIPARRGTADCRSCACGSAIVTCRPPARSRFWSRTIRVRDLVQVAFIVHQISILTPVIGFQSAGGAARSQRPCRWSGALRLGPVADRVDPPPRCRGIDLQPGCGTERIGRFSRPARPGLFLACAVFGVSMGNLITLPALIVQREFPSNAFSVVLGAVHRDCRRDQCLWAGNHGASARPTGGYATPISIGVAIQVAPALAVAGRTARRRMQQLFWIGRTS